MTTKEFSVCYAYEYNLDGHVHRVISEGTIVPFDCYAFLKGREADQNAIPVADLRIVKYTDGVESRVNAFPIAQMHPEYIHHGVPVYNVHATISVDGVPVHDSDSTSLSDEDKIAQFV
jgi:hypothetical protein